MNRPSKDAYYLEIASIVAKRGTCIRRNYGAVIVNNDQIVSTGYTGAPRGSSNCCDMDYCVRQENGVPSGERYELCESVHAEMNAVIAAGRERCIGATIYVVGREVETGDLLSTMPCLLCSRVIRNAGIKTVVTMEERRDI